MPCVLFAAELFCYSLFTMCTEMCLIAMYVPHSLDSCCFSFYDVAVGTRILSGSAACRWYIDEDIPDINSFRERFILQIPNDYVFVLCSFS